MDFYADIQTFIDGVDPVKLAAALSVLKTDHPLSVAARAGLDVHDERQAPHEASRDIAPFYREQRYAQEHAAMVQARQLRGY